MAQDERALPASWSELIEHVNGRTVFGMKGVRDPNALCHAFDPSSDIDWLGLTVSSEAAGSCSGDGHYLCLGCRQFNGKGAEVYGIA